MTRFDILHRLDDYYEPMAISADNKARRRELAELLTDAFLYFFAVYEVYAMHKSPLAKAMYEQLLADRISDAVSKVTGIDSEMSGHIRTLAREVVDTTYRHADINTKDIPDTSSLIYSEEPLGPPLSQSINDSPDGSSPPRDKSDYWLSFSRASDIAYSEANTFFNYTDYREAQDRGLTKKTWHTMLDDKVRDTHEELEGQTIGIDDYFYVGNSQMRFPHDWESSPDPKEVVNCRCAVEYK